MLPTRYDVAERTLPGELNMPVNMAWDAVPGLGLATGAYDIGASAVNALAPGQSMGERASNIGGAWGGVQGIGFNLMSVAALAAAAKNPGRMGNILRKAISPKSQIKLDGFLKGVDDFMNVKMGPVGRYIHGPNGEHWFKGAPVFGRMNKYWHGWRPSGLGATAKEWGKGVGNTMLGATMLPSFALMGGAAMLGSSSALARKHDELRRAFTYAGAPESEANELADKYINTELKHV